MNKVNSICWNGPYPLYPVGDQRPLAFNVEEAQSPGVYLWVVKQPDGRYLTLYVGMTARTIAHRLEQHVRDFLAGKYWIYNAATIIQGKREYIPYGKNNEFTAFLKNYQYLSNKVVEQLKAIEIFFAPIDSDTTFIKRVESSLIELYWDKHLPPEDRFLDNSRRSICINEEDSILISVSGDGVSQIQGMPSELKV